MASLYGRTESGKSEMINLLTGITKAGFSGKCLVHHRDLLKGERLPSNEVGVCLEDENAEESFSLFYHLCFLGQLKGLPRKEMLR